MYLAGRMLPLVRRMREALRALGWCAVVVSLMLCSLNVLAAEFEGERVLLESSTPGDELGSSVSAAGDVLVAGAPYDDELGVQAGAAYVFRYDEDEGSYVEEQRLTASDGDVGAGFGTSVSVSGDVIVVGAYEDAEEGTNAGAAYVFRYDGVEWVQEQKIVADDAASGDRFGYSVAVSGDAIVVGSRGDDDEGTSSGSAYVYRYDDEWEEEDKITASDAAASDLFGWSVSIDGDVLIVGAKWDDDNGSMSGSAYVFRRSGSSWNEESKLVASDGEFNHAFGTAVAIRGERVVVGAYDCCFSGGTGLAYVFEYDEDSEEWDEVQRLSPSDGAEDDLFGISVALGDDIVVVGASEEDGFGDEAGAAYLFQLVDAEWTEIAKLQAPDADEEDEFGTAVSAFGRTVCVGAPFNDEGGTDSGALYVFDTVVDCNSNGVPDAEDLESGESEDCNSNGVPDECDEDSYRAIMSVVAEEPLEGARLGVSLSLEGSYVVAGAPGDPELGGNAGATFVFERGGASLTQLQKLTASDGGSADRFGESVGISGETIVVGAKGVNGTENDTGAAYVFSLEDSEWIESSILTAVDSEARDEFGSHVAIEGDVIAIAAERRDDNETDSGAVYVFESGVDGWTYTQTLWASDPGSGDRFGGGVAVAEGRIFVGASLEDEDAVNSGAIYVFEDDGLWAEVARIKASDPQGQARLGRSLAADGDVLVAGAQVDGEIVAGGGAVYVFRFDGEEWIEEAKLIASDVRSLDSFGTWVAVEGDFIAVGSRGRDVTGINSGSAYVFEYLDGEWVEIDRLSNAVGRAGDQFGAAVGIAERVVICGAPTEDTDDVLDGGGLHTFVDFDCNDNGMPDDCDIADGVSEDCNDNSIPDECENLLADFDILSMAAAASDSDPLLVSFSVVLDTTGDFDYSWNFGDGESSTEESPEHQYELGGEYEVTVVVSEGCGDETASILIDVGEGSKFLRGDADANGVVTGLFDALSILEWTFLNGTTPICIDSADVDDSGEINALVDVLYLLTWGFLDGPEPESPGVDTCGLDPTIDDLSCLDPTGGCE